MRVIFCLSVLTLAAADPQQNGFFSGITGAFNNIFGGSPQQPQRRPQQPQRQPPRQPQFQPQPQQQFQPQQQQQQFQNAAPAFQPAQQPQQQQQQQFNQQQQFRQPQPQQQQSQQFNRPQPQQSFVQQPQPVRQSIRQQQSSVSTQSCPPRNGGTNVCGISSCNHEWTDPRDGIKRQYVVTWKFADQQAGCAKMQQHEARAYCKSLGMEPVSLDSPAKQDEFNRLIASDAQRYFWTGGIVDHAQETVFWSNGRASPVRFSESAHWSHTGGADPPRPQPDNRAKDEVPSHPEVCLGILNNFYADGIKWHDVACHHKKPTVCEPTN